MSVDRETLEKTVNLSATAPKMDDVWMEYVETVFACVTRVELIYIFNFSCDSSKTSRFCRRWIKTLRLSHELIK